MVLMYQVLDMDHIVGLSSNKSDQRTTNTIAVSFGATHHPEYHYYTIHHTTGSCLQHHTGGGAQKERTQYTHAQIACQLCFCGRK